MMMEQIANRYEILSLIGQGGMADVYKAKGYDIKSYCGNQSSA